MQDTALESIAQKLVSPQKGILAADWSVGTATKHFEKLGIKSSEETRRVYREMLFTTEGIEEFISGVILHDETSKQKAKNGALFPELLAKKGIIPGIRVDEGTEAYPNSPNERITKGIETLASRLPEYYQAGLKFTKWRAVITIGDGIPTEENIKENARLLGKFAALSQRNGLVPIVEPEVLMDGAHDIARCEEVTTSVLHSVFSALEKNGVSVKGTILKTNFVHPGKDRQEKVDLEEVAKATLRVLTKTLPPDLPGVVFLSGGDSPEESTAHLNSVSSKEDQPWQLSFSYARALQYPAIEMWKGQDANIKKAQDTFYKRAKLNSLARQGKYTSEMENNTNQLDLLSIGDASLDMFLTPTESEALCTIDEKECLICFSYGDKIPVKTLEFSVGGNAANNAVGVTRLGLKSALVLTLGDDDIGNQIVEKATKEGVDMTYVIQQPSTVSNYSTVINYAAERTIFVYHAPRSYEFPVKLPKTPWVYLTSMGESFRPFYNHVVDWLKKNPEIKLAFNPGSYQLRVDPEVLKDVLALTHMIFVNRQEAERLTGMEESSGQEKELLKKLSALGPKIPVITDGENGSFIFDGSRFVHAGILPIDAHERTGAGDAFGSGCLSGIIKGKTLEEALLWGTINSASVIGYVGPQRGLLKEAEMQEWEERFRSSGVKVEEI